MKIKSICVMLLSISLLSCIRLQPTYAAGWSNPSPSTWYYYNNNGKKLTGWYNPSPSTWYYFKSDGQMVTGLYSVSKDKTYYFNESGDKLGQMYTGWKNINNDWYYFDQDNTEGSLGARHSGWLNLSSPSKPKYYFKNKDKMVTGWLELSPNEKYYFYESGSRLGQMATGTVTINGMNYMFNDQGMLIIK